MFFFMLVPSSPLLVGKGVAASAPTGYRNKGLYPAGLNEKNCPNFPFCHWLPWELGGIPTSVYKYLFML